MRGDLCPDWYCEVLHTAVSFGSILNVKCPFNESKIGLTVTRRALKFRWSQDEEEVYDIQIEQEQKKINFK